MNLRTRIRDWLASQEVGHELTRVIENQLDVFEAEHHGLIADCEAAERASEPGAPGRDKARYADYAELIGRGRDLLDRTRGRYAVTLHGAQRERYLELFHEAVLKRLSRFAQEIELPR
jgi:uncharacterized protein (DUF2336 family)